jgi:FPC/CPF motif-containing protein YcgG
MQAVALAFELTGIRSFLTSMEMRGARIRVIEEASLDLTRYLEGSQDQPPGISFIVSFDSLEDDGRYEISDFYTGNIDSVDRRLKKEFPRVFRQ